MKAISASIVILAGAILLAVGINMRGDTYLLPTVSGIGIGAAGLYRWWREMNLPG